MLIVRYLLLMKGYFHWHSTFRFQLLKGSCFTSSNYFFKTYAIAFYVALPALWYCPSISWRISSHDSKCLCLIQFTLRLILRSLYFNTQPSSIIIRRSSGFSLKIYNLPWEIKANESFLILSPSLVCNVFQNELVAYCWWNHLPITIQTTLTRLVFDRLPTLCLRYWYID